MIDTSAEYVAKIIAAAPFADNDVGISQMVALIEALAAERDALIADNARLTTERDAQHEAKDGAYEERNRLVALLASRFPSGLKSTDIPGWNPEWHGCVYIDFPWGQASWHFHESHAHLFAGLPPYTGEWDGHTTESKYDAIARAALGAS